jgi:glutaryl-CoA dehydrogenase
MTNRWEENERPMAATTTTAPGQAPAALPGDFYSYQDLLAPEDRAVLAAVRAFLTERVSPIADEHWAKGEFPHHLIPEIAALDIAGISAEWPGHPARSNLLTLFINCEFSRVDSSLATFFGVHSGLAMTSVELCGSEEQRRRWLPALREFSQIGAFALTEPEHGSDIAGGLATTARRDGDEWVLDGRKRWIGNATFADLTVVWARDSADGHVKGFVVEKGTPGFHPEKMEGKLALRALENADITLEGARVPEANRLAGANSFADTAKVLRRTRGGVAWNAVGAMMGAYELAVEYACRRRQFGREIGSFQLIQDHLVTMAGDITASLGMAVRVAQLEDQGVFRDEQAALAKSYSTTKLREVVARAREILGGNGILLENKVARFFNDAEALYSFEGSREVNTLIVGRAITGTGAFV